MDLKTRHPPRSDEPKIPRPVLKLNPPKKDAAAGGTSNGKTPSTPGPAPSPTTSRTSAATNSGPLIPVSSAVPTGRSASTASASRPAATNAAVRTFPAPGASFSPHPSLSPDAFALERHSSAPSNPALQSLPQTPPRPPVAATQPARQRRCRQNATSIHPARRGFPRNNPPRLHPNKSVPTEDRFEIKIHVRNLAPGWGTRDVYNFFRRYGTISRVEIEEPLRPDQTCAWVTFKPVPRNTDFLEQLLTIEDQNTGTKRFLHLYHVDNKRAFTQRSPLNPAKTFPELIRVTPESLDVGVMRHEQEMLSLYRTMATRYRTVNLTLDLNYKCIELFFTIPASDRVGGSTETEQSHRNFKARFSFPQLSQLVRMQDHNGRVALIIRLAAPPMVFRKTDDVASTHETGATLWTEAQAWFRQTRIARDVYGSANATQLPSEDVIIELGRWLNYCLIFDKATAESESFKEMCQGLNDFNVPVDENITIAVVDEHVESLWKWRNSMAVSSNVAAVSSGYRDLSSLGQELIDLPFEVLYQLEACISHSVLHESNIDIAFLSKLAALEPNLATRLLESVLDGDSRGAKKRYYRPEEIFKLIRQVETKKTKIPVYCTKIRSAVITPTTVYFNTPTVETSNRVLRHFHQYEDRFLRVKFIDERYRGRVMSGIGDTTDEIFTRIKQTMTNGIRVGGRVYHFLAFGNAQFREGGAYFFASTSSRTAQDIRDWMGNVSSIRVVAKYCSRLGQSFSTTRAMPISVQIERVPDIERNGYTFTDGVGKISPFLAQMIAQEYGLPCSTTDCPSAFQFRLGGCKGVLTVDPNLSRNTIQIRPSQEKFSAVQHRGLEICRISQSSAANLNVQFILVLSSLGVQDSFFLEKMKQMLSNLEIAMYDEPKALDMLQKNIDFNHTTVQLSQMILAGFMKVKEPFIMSCLQLWRSWSTKYLKEKARIFVDQGTFVLGCVDETGILKGHFIYLKDQAETRDATSKQNLDLSKLPQIFLQIPDPDNQGQWKIIMGLCTVGRNPSLHPGDIRVVNAVDVPELHHIRDCVVFPQTGDRDVPNMLSGGDLDGDDFLVIWDKELLPPEWNHPAMNYDGPPPVESQGAVTVDQMTSFFVTHMKYDNLSRIAVAHRYLADFYEDGVKHPHCLELATLHSMAVDFQKTGVPAQLPVHLRPRRWPHWAEVKGKSKDKIYQSKKIIGKLYDEVQRIPFAPAWDLPFDERILNAHPVNESMLEVARDLKHQYDIAVRRLMVKYDIQSEFEIWTTFVLDHSSDVGDYKFAETMGETVSALKDHHRSLCYEAAGTSRADTDRAKLSSFVTAMYRVTADEIKTAMAECKEIRLVGGRVKPIREMTVKEMPFMSFPWLFTDELGLIATGEDTTSENTEWLANLSTTGMLIPSKQQPYRKQKANLIIDSFDVDPRPEVKPKDETLQSDDLLDLSHEEDFKVWDETESAADRVGFGQNPFAEHGQGQDSAESTKKSTDVTSTPSIIDQVDACVQETASNPALADLVSTKLRGKGLTKNQQSAVEPASAEDSGRPRNVHRDLPQKPSPAEANVKDSFCITPDAVQGLSSPVSGMRIMNSLPLKIPEDTLTLHQAVFSKAVSAASLINKTSQTEPKRDPTVHLGDPMPDLIDFKDWHETVGKQEAPQVKASQDQREAAPDVSREPPFPDGKAPNDVESNLLLDLSGSEPSEAKQPPQENSKKTQVLHEGRDFGQSGKDQKHEDTPPLQNGHADLRRESGMTLQQPTSKTDSHHKSDRAAAELASTQTNEPGQAEEIVKIEFPSKPSELDKLIALLES